MFNAVTEPSKLVFLLIGNILYKYNFLPDSTHHAGCGQIMFWALTADHAVYGLMVGVPLCFGGNIHQAINYFCIYFQVNYQTEYTKHELTIAINNRMECKSCFALCQKPSASVWSDK